MWCGGLDSITLHMSQADGMGVGNSRKGIEGSLGPMCKGILFAFFFKCWLFEVKCHTVMGEDLVRCVTAPATKTKLKFKSKFPGNEATDRLRERTNAFFVAPKKC